MITELNTFSPGSLVVSDDWNANFRALNTANTQHAEAITDAQNNVATVNDASYTTIYNIAKTYPNSQLIDGLDVYIYPGQEYYKNIPSGGQLILHAGDYTYGEARILFKLEDQRTSPATMPFILRLEGDVSSWHVTIGQTTTFNFIPGYYYLMIYGYDRITDNNDTRHVITSKVIWTGA